MTEHLTLCSHSPRRKQILKAANYKFEVKSVEVDESFPLEMNKTKVAEFIAVQKNKHHQKIFNNEIIITADTTVVLEDEILGKPDHFEEAKSMLERLSGQHPSSGDGCLYFKSKSADFFFFDHRSLL